MHIDGMSRAAGLWGNDVGAVFPLEVEFFLYILMVGYLLGLIPSLPQVL